jgi:hypothetical protein
MRHITFLSSLVLAGGAAAAQETPKAELIEAEPIPLPVQVQFQLVGQYSNRQDTLFSERLILDAVGFGVSRGMLSAEVVSVDKWVDPDSTEQLIIEIDIYGGRGIRIETEHFGAGSESTRSRLCRTETKGSVQDPLQAALLITHQARTAAECVRERIGIRWK